MFTDRLVGRLPFFNTRAKSAPQRVQEVPVQTHEPASPLEVIRGAETPLSAKIRESFEVQFLAAGELIPFPDQDGRQLYYCGTNDKGGLKYWLDPKKWAATLSEFSDFAQAAGAHDVKLAVEQHEPALTSHDHEWITVRPVTMDSNRKVKETEYVYGITQDGRVSFGNTRMGFRDLGYLNPQRIRDQQVAALKETLSHRTI